jgi:iron complex outermembrane receptor protein
MKPVARRLLYMALPAIAATPVWAQGAPQTAPQAAAAASDSSIGEIVVTARRRAENIEKVPIAITAISSEDIQKRAIYNENDLQSAVPGLVIRQNGGVHAFNYAIRGQSVDTFTNSPPSVLPYVDEVQIVTHSASTFYDMSGIQVLKGPQGTLFGRNATGGAVLYTTAKADDHLGGYIDGRYGNYKSLHLEGAVNIPAGEKVALRIAGSFTHGGAFVHDYFNGAKYGDLDQKSIRGTLRLSPTEQFTNTTVVQYTKEHGSNTPYELWSTNPCGGTNGSIQLNGSAACQLNPVTNPVFAAYLKAHPAVFQGSLDQAIALQRQLGPWQSLADYNPFHHAKSRYAINTSTYEISPQLTLKNIFGYNKADSDDGYDYDSSPFQFFENQGNLNANGKVDPAINGGAGVHPGFLLHTRQISDEFQVQGKAIDNRLDYVVGVYYLNQRDSVSSNLVSYSYGPPPAGISNFPFTYTAEWTDHSIAGFAQATYKVTDKLSLTGGFRYTHDKTSIHQLPGSLWLLFFPENPHETTKKSKPSWTASVDYKITNELLVYAATRGSWRAGGFNYSVQPVNSTAADGGNRFSPETTEDVEVGFKYSGDSLGVPITWNADFFNQWVKNIQRSAYISTAAGVDLLTANVPKAEITGLEGDFTVRPVEWLTFGGSGNYTHARYTSPVVNVLGFVVTYGPFADVPKWSGTLFGEVATPLGNDVGTLRFRLDGYGQTQMHFSNTSATIDPNTTLPGYILLNGRITWDGVMGQKLQASLFVRNLTKKKYFVGGNPSSAGGAMNAVDPGSPRMWGGELKFSF